MNRFLTLAFLFFIGSTTGWVLELFYRRIFSAHRWLNPGFLIGPYLPLYGFGLCLLYALATIDLSFIGNRLLRTVFLFVLMGIAMTAIEYLAGKIFIVGMKVKLWDYSNRWGNLQGIICPEFSFYWTILGILYYVLLHPAVTGAVEWLFSNLAFSFIIGFFFGVLVIDFSYSIQLLARIRTYAKEKQIVVKLEELKKDTAERLERVKTRPFFLLIRFLSLPRQLKAYHEKNLKGKNHHV